MLKFSGQSRSSEVVDRNYYYYYYYNDDVHFSQHKRLAKVLRLSILRAAFCHLNDNKKCDLAQLSTGI